MNCDPNILHVGCIGTCGIQSFELAIPNGTYVFQYLVSSVRRQTSCTAVDGKVYLDTSSLPINREIFFDIKQETGAKIGTYFLKTIFTVGDLSEIIEIPETTNISITIPPFILDNEDSFKVDVSVSDLAPNHNIILSTDISTFEYLTVSAIAVSSTIIRIRIKNESGDIYNIPSLTFNIYNI